jgi:TonB family protein
MQMRVSTLRTAFLGGLALALAAASAQAQIIREPDRAHSALRVPPEAMARFYPKVAQRAHVGGRVMLSCQGRPGGVLAACAVRSESPTGYGFGAAALAMSAHMPVGDQPCGRPGPCRIQFPVTFRPH